MLHHQVHWQERNQSRARFQTSLRNMKCKQLRRFLRDQMRNELAAVNYMAWKKRWLQLRVPNSSGFNPTQINVQQCTENGAVTDVPAISRMQKMWEEPLLPSSKLVLMNTFFSLFSSDRKPSSLQNDMNGLNEKPVFLLRRKYKVKITWIKVSPHPNSVLLPKGQPYPLRVCKQGYGSRGGFIGKGE